MKKLKIAVLDSGIGGLYVLKECVRFLPNAQFIYMADTQNAPYGVKSTCKLKKLAKNLVQGVIDEYQPDIIVVACNTLTVTAIKSLRKKFSIPFVGIEPALKSAQINGGKTIFFATARTISLRKKLIKKIGFNRENLVMANIENLPSLIEKNYNNLQVLKPKLFEKFISPVFKGSKNLLLGCTHFIALKPMLKEILGEDIKIYDGAEPVARQTQKIAQNLAKTAGFELNLTPKNLPQIKFMTTCAIPRESIKLKKYFGELCQNDR